MNPTNLSCTADSAIGLYILFNSTVKMNRTPIQYEGCMPKREPSTMKIVEAVNGEKKTSK